MLEVKCVVHNFDREEVHNIEGVKLLRHKYIGYVLEDINVKTIHLKYLFSVFVCVLG